MTDIDFSIDDINEESVIKGNIFNFDIGENIETFNISDLNYDINLLDSTTIDVDLVQSYPVNLEWGQIIGNLSNQTDLQNILNSKASKIELSNHVGDYTIHYKQDEIELSESQITDLDKYTKNEVDILRQNLSAGLVTIPTYLDNGDGTVTIGNATCRLYSTSDHTGNINYYSVNGDTFTLTDLNTNYIVIDYNGGNPIMKNILDVSLINESDVIPIYTLSRIGTDICRISWNTIANGLANKLHSKDMKLNKFQIENGLALGETGIRNISLGAGVIWNGTNRNELDAIDTSQVENDIYLFYHSSGNWTHSVITQYNNTQYDDGTNLSNLLPNRYTVNWVFRAINTDKKRVCIVLGNDNYTLSEAESSTMPEIPKTILESCIFVGRIIVQKNKSVAQAIEQVQNISLAYTQISDHNNLSGIQGGTVNEYYHLTSSEYDKIDYLNQDLKTTASPTFNEISVSTINSDLTNFQHLNIPSDVLEPNENDIRISNCAIEFYDGSEWQSADCPKIITIKKTSQSSGDLHLYDSTYWNTSKALLNIIKIKTNSTNWNLWLLQNGNGYSADDARISKFQLMRNGYMDKNIYLGNFPYEDEDETKNVHLYFEDLSGSNTFDITIQGVKAR